MLKFVDTKIIFQIQITKPYEPLYFPIPDEIFDSMVKEMPEDHQSTKTNSTSSNSRSARSEMSNLSNAILSSTITLASTNKICDENNKNQLFNNDSTNYKGTDKTGDRYDGERKVKYSPMPSARLDYQGQFVDAFNQRTHLDEHEFSTFTSGNNLIGESDCESTDSGQVDDPNDPEWKEEPE